MDYELYGKAIERLRRVKTTQGKKGMRRFLWAILLGIALGIALVLIEYILFDFGTYYDSTSLIAALLIAMLLQLIAHELGHLFFGLATGYRFVSFRIYFLALYKKGSKLKFGRYSVPGTAGQCLMYPPEGKNGYVPHRLINLGGVLVNLFLTVVSLVLVLLFYHAMPHFLFNLLVSMIFWGILFAVNNGIPRKTEAAANDGYHVKELAKDPEALKFFLNQLRLNAAMTEGLRLRDMPEDWFAMPQTESTPGVSATYMRIMSAERLLDLGDLKGAQAELLSLAAYDESLPAHHLYLIMSELLYLEMMGEHRREIVESFYLELDRFFKASKNSFTTLRVLSTYHYLFSGNLQEVEKNKKRFDKLAKHFPFVGEVARERMLLDYPAGIYENWQRRQDT